MKPVVVCLVVVCLAVSVSGNTVTQRFEKSLEDIEEILKRHTDAATRLNAELPFGESSKDAREKLSDAKKTISQQKEVVKVIKDGILSNGDLIIDATTELAQEYASLLNLLRFSVANIVNQSPDDIKQLTSYLLDLTESGPCRNPEPRDVLECTRKKIAGVKRTKDRLMEINAESSRYDRMIMAFLSSMLVIIGTELLWKACGLPAREHLWIVQIMIFIAYGVFSKWQQSREDL